MAQLKITKEQRDLIKYIMKKVFPKKRISYSDFFDIMMNRLIQDHPKIKAKMDYIEMLQLERKLKEMKEKQRLEKLF